MSIVIVKVDVNEELHRALIVLNEDPSLLSKFGNLISEKGYGLVAMIWIICQIEEAYGITITHTLLPPEMMGYVNTLLNKYPFSFLQQSIIPPNVRAVTGFDFSHGTLSLTVEVD